MNKKPSTFASVTERDKKLLLLLGTIIVLSFSYFFVFSPNTKKASEVKATNQQLQVRVDTLNEMTTHRQEKLDGIAQFNEDRNKILDKFPGGMTTEKSISILDDMEKETEVAVSAVNFAMNEIFYDAAIQATADGIVNDGTAAAEGTDAAATPAPADGEATPAPTDASGTDTIAEGVDTAQYSDITGYKSTLTLTFSTSNASLKKAIDYINEYKDKMSIDSITVAYDATTGDLLGTMNLAMFALDGNGKEYEEPVIEGIKNGVKSIFGTVDTKKNKGKKKR